MSVAALILRDAPVVTRLDNCETQTTLAVESRTIDSEIKIATDLTRVGGITGDVHFRSAPGHDVAAHTISTILCAQHFIDGAALVIDRRRKHGRSCRLSGRRLSHCRQPCCAEGNNRNFYKS